MRRRCSCCLQVWDLFCGLNACAGRVRCVVWLGRLCALVPLVGDDADEQPWVHVPTAACPGARHRPYPHILAATDLMCFPQSFPAPPPRAAFAGVALLFLSPAPELADLEAGCLSTRIVEACKERSTPRTRCVSVLAVCLHLIVPRFCLVLDTRCLPHMRPLSPVVRCPHFGVPLLSVASSPCRCVLKDFVAPYTHRVD